MHFTSIVWEFDYWAGAYFSFVNTKGEILFCHIYSLSLKGQVLFRFQSSVLLRPLSPLTFDLQNSSMVKEKSDQAA